MLRHYGFDLSEWVACRRHGSTRLVLAMLNNLPEGSKYVAIKSAPGSAAEHVEPDPEEVSAYERLVWTLDRRLQAQGINAIQFLIKTLIELNGAEPPEFPIVGPSDWKKGDDTQTSSDQPTRTVMDVLKMFG